MTGIVNWLRESNLLDYQLIRINKADFPATSSICEILENQLGVDITDNSVDFAKNNANKIIEITTNDRNRIETLLEFQRKYFNDATTIVLESYDEKQFLDELVLKIDYGQNYLPVWVAKFNWDGNTYCWVIDNELDCRFGWEVINNKKTLFTTLEDLLKRYRD
jgi:hypothetical protein